MNNGRDCPHGRQVGKCDTCDLIKAELELEKVTAERNALAAQVEIMQGNFEHIMNYWNRDNNHDAMENACWMAVNTSADMINLNKFDCLVNVKACAVSDFIAWATTNVDPEFSEWQDFANTYADQLRAKAGEA